MPMYKLQDFSVEGVQGYRAEQPHKLLAEKDLPDGLTFKDLASKGLHTETLLDEKGPET